MKTILTSIFITFSVGVFAQITSDACSSAENVCDSLDFLLWDGQSSDPTVPPNGGVSNPSGNPQGVNSGCLYANELNPNWFVINVASSGCLEFQIGAPGGSGYFDWSLWPYDPATACADIASNSLAPVACNWNASAQGFTGMNSGGPPPGGIAGNFQPTINVVAGQQYILMFSNYSSQVGTMNLTFPSSPCSADVTCTAGTPDQTICLGTAADVTILLSPNWTSPTFNWLVTTNVSNPTGGVNVMVNPPVTTQYSVEVSDAGAVVDTVDFTITVVNPPNPNAGPDQTTCLGDPIQLAGTANDPVNNTVQWTTDWSAVFPPPVIAFAPNTTDLNPVVTANQLGSYLFILEETNATCGAFFDTVEVIVGELQIAASSVAPSCEGFNDGQILITSADAVEYSYDGGVTWIVDSFYVTASAGAYFVCAKSITGCQKCVNVDVIDPAAVTISVSVDTLICENGTGYLSASATGGTSYLFNWDFTGSTAASQVVNPAIATTYTVYAENQNGCVSPPETIDVTIRPPLTGTISLWDTVCPTYSTDLSATVVGGLGVPYTFVWSSGDTYTGMDNDMITVTPMATTMYTVTVTDECESTPLVMTTNVRVAPVPDPQLLVLNPIQCEPAIFDIVNSTDPTMSEFVYWLVDDQYQYVNQDTITTPELWAGDYDIQMIITSYEGCIDSTTFEAALTVQPKPVADFRYSPNPVTMFNTEVSFVNYSFNGFTYRWFFDGGYPSQSTQTNVQVQYPDGVVGTYDVMLITTSELGCIDTTTQEVVVYPEVIIYAPNTFTPDGDEHNQGWRIFMEGIDVYDFELLIFDRWGGVVWESHDITVAWDGTFSGTDLPQGTYNWVVRTKDILNDAKYTYTGHINILR